MVILSDCITEMADEGCIKIASTLAKKLKEQHPETILISYKKKAAIADLNFKLNKLFLNWRFLLALAKMDTPVLYIPNASNTIASAIRVFLLSLFLYGRVHVLFALRYPMNSMTLMLLKSSNAKIVALSQESFGFYRSFIGEKVLYLKAGIDTSRFVPVDPGTKILLREKYGVFDNKKVLLHVGHLNSGRNIRTLLNVKDEHHVFLVVSTATAMERDMNLYGELTSKSNITIIDKYIEHIEELYQMADVYLFPVQHAGNCIDVPLSVLEAAACNIPIITTDYGELKIFRQERGFCFIDSFDETSLNEAVARMTRIEGYNNRQAVLPYDWELAVQSLIQNINS